jgi:hypothetical protein
MQKAKTILSGGMYCTSNNDNCSFVDMQKAKTILSGGFKPIKLTIKNKNNIKYLLYTSSGKKLNFFRDDVNAGLLFVSYWLLEVTCNLQRAETALSGCVKS